MTGRPVSMLGRLSLLIATAVPVAFVVLLVFGSDEKWMSFDIVTRTSAFVLAFSTLVLAYYEWLIARNLALSKETKTLWAVVVFVAGPFGQIAYFLKYVLHSPPSMPRGSHDV